MGLPCDREHVQTRQAESRVVGMCFKEKFLVIALAFFFFFPFCLSFFPSLPPLVARAFLPWSSDDRSRGPNICS